ncbi:MAG: hypothetical protein KAG89_17620 [Fulvimarina manganoxydans]|uniref:HWE histidine kinase domain-containing protein n=1 Tax=Fulvimarina manganoxydans TaxID=937218 RepID=UPI0023573820|nr:HWE histidine kinase domain-containing protein [Fulvimarina manganoxydans]MCK5933983.1 hypothetical protein [Fulvimarina manganoxydans]
MSVNVEAGQTRGAGRKLLSFLPTRLRKSRLAHFLRRPPLLFHLVVFALIVLVPALMFSAVLIVQFSSQQQQITSAQVNDTAEIVSTAFDREVVGLLATARVLASSSTINGSDYEAFRQRSALALGSAHVVADLISPDGRIVASTAPDPASRSSLADQPILQTTFATGRSGVSGVFTIQRTGQRAFSVLVPTSPGPNPPHVLALTKTVEALDSVLDVRSLPRAWSSIVTDADGKWIFAATASEGQMKPQGGISYDHPSIIEALPGGRADDMIQASSVSPITGWTTTVAVPSAVIDRPVMRSWVSLIAVGLVLSIFSVALGVTFGRRLARPILELSKQAEAIGQGQPTSPIRTDIAEIGEVSKVLNQASRDRREAEEQTRFLMREMTHRAKNQYALIGALARRAARESANTGEFLDTLSEALNSLARSAELLSGNGWEAARLDQLVDNQLKPFGADAGRIERSGPDVKVNASVAQTIGLAFHELATNAAKYGSLSVDTGRIVIDWSLGETFRIRWREMGGPKVVKPTRSGFGTLVTQKMTARGLGGAVDMRFEESGVVWVLEAPRDSVEAA